jgi:hypothetical protein
MTPLEKRIELLERKSAQQEREIAQLKKMVRERSELHPRNGWFLGITRKDYTQGGADEFIEVDIYYWSTTIGKWRKKVVAPLGYVKARDWYLNADEVLEEKTKVKIEHYENTWVVTGMYCSPTDLEEFGGRSPGSQSPGELEPSMPYAPSPISSGGSYGDSYSSPGFEE